MINFLTIALKIISFALVSAILISLPFLSSVRGSFFYLFSAVLDNGLIGFYIAMFLLNLFIPSLRFWYLVILNKGKFVESFKSILKTTPFEKTLDKFIYIYLPAAIFVFYFIRIYILQ